MRKGSGICDKAYGLGSLMNGIFEGRHGFSCRFRKKRGVSSTMKNKVLLFF